MAGATSGQLIPGGFVGIRDLPHAAPGAVYGRGPTSVISSFVRQSAGLYKVSGTVKQTGTLTPLHRFVRLLSMNGTIFRGCESIAPDGSFQFLNVPAGKYIVLGIDQNEVQNAVVFALVDAVAM